MGDLTDLDPDDVSTEDDQVHDEVARKQAIEEAVDVLDSIENDTTVVDLDTSTDEYRKLENHCVQLADALVGESDVTWFVEDTFLSEREAEVFALKQRGLTHGAITLFYQVLAHAEYDGHQFVDGPQSRSTVDEYSRRARRKYQRAKETVAVLKSHYG